LTSASISEAALLRPHSQIDALAGAADGADDADSHDSGPG
jgi:hypothetical protein